MSQSDLGNAVQQYENPQIEEITDDTEMPTTNEEYNHSNPSEADQEIHIANVRCLYFRTYN